jgi:hypothetical protein
MITLLKQFQQKWEPVLRPELRKKAPSSQRDTSPCQSNEWPNGDAHMKKAAEAAFSIFDPASDQCSLLA